MIEKTIYVCEICDGSYLDKGLAAKCESSGYPKHYNEFVNKWIITPIQIMEHLETLESSSVDSRVIWFPVRIEGNKITSPANYDLMNQLRLVTIAHSIKFSSRGFYEHFLLKQFLDYAIIVDEKYRDELNKLLVENEICRQQKQDNVDVMKRVRIFMDGILAKENVVLPQLEDVEKYEYKSSL